MNLSTKHIKRILLRKVATVLLVAASAGSFAMLGDGGKRTTSNLNPEVATSRTFSLRTASYKPANLFANRPSRFIMLNTVVTVQKGNATYILPLKKKVLLDKIKFSPSRF